MILEKLLAHYHCSDIFQLPTGKWKGHEADENIFQLLVGKCGGGYTGRDKPIADFFAHHKGKVNCFLGAAETLVRQSIDEYLKDGRDHLQVAFGCTGNAPAAKRSGRLSANPKGAARGRAGTAPCTSPSACPSGWQELMAWRLKCAMWQNHTGNDKMLPRLTSYA